MCNRALTGKEQLDISGVATGADPATGKLNGQYPDQAKSDDWQCEQFVTSVSGDLSKCQPVTGTCYELWTPNGPPHNGLHKPIPKIPNDKR